MKKSFLKFLLTPLILIHSISYGQVWNEVNGYNGIGRHHPITIANENYGYIIAGQDATFSNNLDQVYKYDPILDDWMQIDPFPGGGRGYGYGVYEDNDAYLGFGSNGTGYPTDWWHFDMNNEQWSQLSSFPGTGRNHPAMILANNKIFVGLGSNSSGNLDDWWEYDIDLNSWSQLPTFIGAPRHHPFFFGIGNKAYVGFGHGNSINGQLNIFNDFFVWDAELELWAQLNDFPGEGRVAGTQFSYNGKGYILSGDGDNHGPLDYGEFWEYNPDTDSWSELPPHPGGARWAPGSFVLGCNIYFTSGLVGDTNSFPTDLYQYAINEDCGCTDENALNFSPSATIDDGSCCYVGGCTDINAFNYNPDACFDDNSCIPINLGCTDPSFSDYDPDANIEVFTGGPTSLNEYGTGGYHYNDSWDMIFNVSEDTYISSIEMNAQNSGAITIDIINANGSVFAQFDYNLNPGWNTLSLETLIPQGDNYTIGVTGNNQSLGLYRNNAVPNGVFPIEIANRITIIGSTTDSPTTCPAGEIPDCNGNCAPAAWIGDQYCDDGTYNWNGNQIYFNCEEFECDGGDCVCENEGPQSYFYYFYNWTIDASCSGSLSNQESFMNYISMYPNPTSDYLFLENNLELEAKVYDLNGKLILIEYITDKLDISCLEDGIYIINLSNGVNNSSHRIIKN